MAGRGEHKRKRLSQATATPKSATKSKKELSSKSETKPKKLSTQLHTKVPGFEIPSKILTLNRLSKAAGITTINNLPQNCLGSGSDVTQKQFVALRIISVQEKFKEIKFLAYWRDWDLDRLSIEATRLVDECPEFQAYLRLISTCTPVRTVEKRSSDWPGSLKPVKVFHEQILRKKNQETTHSEAPLRELRSGSRPTEAIQAANSGRQSAIPDFMQRTPAKKPPEIQPSETNFDSDDSDEASDDSDKTYVDPSEYLVAVKETTPNSALILLLQATCDLVLGVPMEWTLDPTHFRPKFRLGQFNVYTDGALRSTKDESVLSIVEVKREMRENNPEAVRMQEGVEMASWILSERKKNPSLQKLVK
ncbi:uncharacterized protein BHQ10_005538 [Talaromyces amestolkiae]|uniref:Uncharacterized protein n=1 Tax=Talaromyces amestolkiae TaxID=1196081 RepID=A0A364L153_TALAM|nr:uncharacterized protein BHQ10_005538 [Talaromyces amestolkiae]RAO69526.1 hypothetical protein BHQ10_005538 [Talaromyces amestolkiae]